MRFAYPIFSPLIYAINILALPLTVKRIKSLFMEGMLEGLSLDPKLYLIKTAESLNFGIKGLKEISEKFKNIN